VEDFDLIPRREYEGGPRGKVHPKIPRREYEGGPLGIELEIRFDSADFWHDDEGNAMRNGFWGISYHISQGPSGFRVKIPHASDVPVLPL
jgi:hypothetical protein